MSDHEPVPENPVQRVARRLERRVFLAVFLGELARWLLGLAFVVGALVLLLRAGLRWPTDQAAWCALLFLAAPVLAWRRARARRLNRRDAAAWLDVQSGASGALVTGGELVDQRWAPRVRAELARVPRLPAPRLVRPGANLALGAGFALFALWVHVPEPEVGPSTRLFEAQLERLGEQLDVLEEQVALDEEVAREMERRLEELEQELDGERFESTYEALDRMERSLAEEAQRAAATSQQASDALDEALRAAAQDAEAARAELTQALATLSEAGLTQDLPAELMRALSASALATTAGLDAAALSELSEELRELLEGKLSALAAAGLLGTHPGLGQPGEFASLDDFEEHVCDEECTKPGGT